MYRCWCPILLRLEVMCLCCVCCPCQSPCFILYCKICQTIPGLKLLQYLFCPMALLQFFWVKISAFTNCVTNGIFVIFFPKTWSAHSDGPTFAR